MSQDTTTESEPTPGPDDVPDEVRPHPHWGEVSINVTKTGDLYDGEVVLRFPLQGCGNPWGYTLDLLEVVEDTSAPELRDAHEANLDNIREARNNLLDIENSIETVVKAREVLDVLENRTLDVLESLE